MAITTEKKHDLKWMRVAVGAFYFAMGLTFASWASRIPDVQRALGLTDGQLGMVLFAIPVGQLCMMAVSGWLVARFGSRVCTMLALLMYGVVLTSISLANNVPLLLASLFLFGAMANWMNIAVNTQAVFVERLYGRNILSSFHGMWSLGGLAGGIVGAVFATTTLPLGFHYATILAVVVLTIVLGHDFLVRQDPTATDDEPKESFSLRHVEGLIVVLGVIGFGGMFCEGTVYDWSSVYFANVVKPDDTFIRAGYIAGMAAMTCGRFVADRFVTRYGASRVLGASGVFIVVGLLMAVVFPQLIPATIGFLLVGVGISSIVPICYSVAGKHTHMKVSTAITLVSTVSFVGFLIGPPVIGFVSEASNLRVSIGLASAFGVFIVILSKLVNKKITLSK